jgi:beta-mannosidase
MTAGPWRPVRLEVSSTFINSVRIDYGVAKNLSSVTGCVVANVEGPADEIAVIVSDGDTEVFHATQKAVNVNNNIEFKIGK